VKFAKARTAANGKAQIDIAIPSFGYKNHVAIDQRFGFIRKAVVTHGARHDGSQLREVVTTNNTASDVWADTAYRSKTNEAWLAAHGRVIPSCGEADSDLGFPNGGKSDSMLFFIWRT
jgi:hypothetical protein